MVEGFSAAAWRCRACAALLDMLDNARRCPWCEAAVETVDDLREAMVRAAESSGARVTVVPAGTDLDRHGGVGALLRFQGARPEVPAPLRL